MHIRISLVNGKKEYHEGVRRIKIRRNYVKLVFWRFCSTYRKPIYYNRDEWAKAEVKQRETFKAEDLSVGILK